MHIMCLSLYIFQIYVKVSEVLAPWPQLLSIFTDYLDCSEAIKANVVSYDYVTMATVSDIVCGVVCYCVWCSVLMCVV